MKKHNFLIVSKSNLIVIILLFSGTLLAQSQAMTSNQPDNFWRNVQFGGGVGLSIGSGYTDISVSPSAIYNINPIVAVGTAFQFGYVSSKNYYTSNIYGASLIGLINPIPEIQLSTELEEINVNTDYKSIDGNNSSSFWNTSLYLGAGYRSGNVTIGVRYNVLFDKNKSYYNDPFMPFVRVYF
ncbi:hypothetical protein [Flavobacterium cellulosilyticum]|uniref:Alpha-ketoglutarate decarboxylase n=1 Tax=Flavobacterium cellulosilyticum TaxID=2541731 RepID=A0A4R5CP96_9FLAO|nr:hypothetical protein [Flavobacterium cellulosilyticum]TDD99414.1 hypothetical protein E0F76_01435 [Flavobacterium cellulosilyticum]